MPVLEEGTGRLVLDNTKQSTFVACPRKFYWNWVRALRPKIGSPALRYGTTWHAVLEAFYNSIRAEGWADTERHFHTSLVAGKAAWDRESEGFDFPEDYRTFENIAKSFLVYIQQYSSDAVLLEIVDTEERFSIPISFELFASTTGLNPVQVGFVPFVLTGRLDMRIKMNNMLWLYENKTTGRYLAESLARLNRSPQLIDYIFACKTLGREVTGALVSIHHLSSRRSKTTGLYGEPKIEFARSPMVFSQADMGQWLAGFAYSARQIYSCFDQNFWPMCHQNCYQFGACAYTALCEQDRPLDEVDTSLFIVKDWDVRSAA